MHFTALALPSALALLVGCAGTPQLTATATASCEVAKVPADAVLGVRHAMDIATWPSKPPRGQGCQRVWYGERTRPEAMQVLATYYFDQGRVYRLVGRVPGGAGYECQYRDGTLDAAASRNPEQCPKATELKPGM